MAGIGGRQDRRRRADSTLQVHTFFCPISTAVSVRQSSDERYLRTLTSSFMSDGPGLLTAMGAELYSRLFYCGWPWLTRCARSQQHPSTLPL